MNVGVANQFSPLQTDIMNKLMAYRAEGADKLVWNGQQEDKSFRNSWRNYLRNLDMADIANYDYNTKMNMLNATNPYYNVIDGPGANQLDLSDVWPNPAYGNIVDHLIVDIDPATGTATVPFVTFGDYGALATAQGAYDNDVAGYVFSCTGYITLTMKLTYNGVNQGNFKLILQKN